MYEAYLNPELAVLSVVLYAVGSYLKKSEFRDKYIPLVLGCIGIVLATVYICITDGVNARSAFNGIVQGVLYAASAVYANQIVKQAKED